MTSSFVVTAPASPSTEILSRIKAEGCRPSDRTGCLPGAVFSGEVFAPMGLASVFDDRYAVLFGQVDDRIHFAHLSIEMNRNNCFDGLIGMFFEVLPQCIDTHIRGLRIDIDKLRG